jgi:peptidoglycan-associated lipoprotein
MKQSSFRNLLAALALTALLPGCAALQDGDVPIEERAGGERIQGSASTPGSSSSPSQTVPIVMRDTASVVPAAQIATPAPAETVQTRGLPAADVHDMTSGGAAGAGGAVPLADPNSPLAQRVIYFAFDSAVIPEQAHAMLEAHAAFLKGSPAAKGILQGHTDERGSREYNIALGQRRAEGVYRAMAILGVPEASLEAVSMGEEKPAAEGNDEAAWSLNRRVEIRYQGE